MNVRTIKKKIKSVNNVQKITKAMQLVSAVKMKKAQQVAIDGKPYGDELTAILRNITKRIDSLSSPLLQQPKDASKPLYIVISSNKGLCGAFHTTLNRTLFKQITIEGNDFITVGKKGGQFVSRMRGNVIADFNSLHPTTEASAIFKLAVERFLTGVNNEIHIVYNEFRTTLTFETVIHKLLPFDLSHFTSVTEAQEATSFYLIEPASSRLIHSVLLNYIEEQIRVAILNSEAVEHSQRMIAMKNATENSKEVIYNLRLVGNKLRQGTITSELLDMVTAKESVDSGN